MAYKSLIAQTLHYFSRPHNEHLLAPLETPAAWKNRDLVKSKDWRAKLNSAEIKEVKIAVGVALQKDRPLGELTSKDFPLPTLAAKISTWREALSSGRGLQVIQGLPVKQWSQQEVETFFWCFGLHLGQPGAQNPQGDLLGHVTDTRASAEERLYATSKHIAFHCDAADVVGLLCLNKARSGGQSRIVSSVAVYNELLKRRPDLVARLYRPFLLDTRSDSVVNYVPIEPCRYADGQLRTFYHSDYFRSVTRHKNVAAFSPQELELLNLYEKIANSKEFYFDMDLQPGDIQLLSNHSILHSRTKYVDYKDPAKKRHLLRLWLSLESKMPLRSAISKEMSRLGMLGNFVAAQITGLVRRN